MRCRTAVLVISVFVLVTITDTTAQVFLPGMQPKEAGIEFGKVQQCLLCHGGTKNGGADPFFSWQGGMMAQSARDPVFLAALAIANQDVEGVGEFCWRCHAPRGWLEDRSKPADGSQLNREDRYGVSCDICHHLIDPLSSEAASLIKEIPPGYGNAMMVADPANVSRGPYGDGTGAKPHKVKKSAYHASSELCAVCHNVSNPLLAEDVRTQPPHSFGHIERTYSEWLLSDFAKQDREGTCQSCHYDVVPGGGQTSRYEDRLRDYFVKHGPPGGSTWVQDATWMLWKGKDMDRKALDMGKERALKLLRTSASLDINFYGNGKATVRITNLTGHKLPTGYPEGRRMWVNVRFLDADGGILDEIGRYGLKEDTLFNEPVRVPTLLDPGETRIYKCLPAMSKNQAEKHGKKPGPSFHFVLNDTIAFDNRIPPKGFKNDRFAEHLCQPVGATYEDGQYWDDVELGLPEDCAKVSVRLMYQSVSWEYIRFLAEENKTDEWGKRLHEAWTETGKCPPVSIAEKVAGVDD
ncbi:MAG: hypothetical protein ACYTG7_01355 [Planctomycetota bacterium]